MDHQILITQIEEVPSELGEPDCKLIKPFLIKTNGELAPTLESWLSDYTLTETFMMHSDKILTITEPKPTLLEKYKNLTK
jgi:hypothetical protein